MDRSKKIYFDVFAEEYVSERDIDPIALPERYIRVENTEEDGGKYDITQECKADHKDCKECILDKIKSEIENYKLSEDEISEMDEDSVKWGMAIVIGIIDKYINER